ncbi:MAG: substrate-binding domain-containing protein [Pseudomonadota bacterium]
MPRPILALLLFFCFAAPLHAQAADPVQKKYVVAFAQDTMANDWRVAQVRDLKNALAAHADIEFVFSDAKGDNARQIQDIENFAAQGVDVLITSPRDAELMREPIARVYRKGIPVILLSRRVNGEEFTHFVTADNHAIARQAAAYLARRLNGKGNILMLQHIPSTTPGQLRTEGFYEELRKHPGLKVVAVKRADSLRALAIQRIEEALAEKLRFDAIYAQSDSMALGAILALKKAGIDPRSIPITGIDYIGETRAAIRAGEIAASFTYPTFGREGAAAAVTLLRGGKLARKEVVVESVAVTRENVDKVEPIF